MNSSNYAKHTSKNPLQRYLINRFYRVLLAYAGETAADYTLDAGCGEGFTLDKLRRAKLGGQLAGFDASETAVKTGMQMFPDIRLATGNIYHIKKKDKSFDLVICSEVLEHLENPGKALAELRRVSRNYLLLTVPWEPWFQLTNFLLGKYIRRWGNHPEHINHWNLSSFIRLLAQHKLTVLRASVSFPWVLVLARR